MTKVTTLAELIGGKTEKKKGKPIEFVHCVWQSEAKLAKPHYGPHEYENVILISRAGAHEKYDVFAAYDECAAYQDSPSIYLGYLNDGFVEQ